MEPDPRQTYCLDTSSLLEAWGRSYRPANWPSFRMKLEKLIADGRCVICEEVKTEIEDDAANLIDWARKQPGFLVNYDRDQELVVKQIMRDYPRLANLNRNKGWADPFVVASAKCRGYTVVTEEGPGAAEGPKIPFVCKKLGVSCISLVSMIEQEGWTF